MKLNVRNLLNAIKEHGVDMMVRFYSVSEETGEAKYIGPVLNQFDIIDGELDLYVNHTIHGYAIGQDILDFLEKNKNKFEKSGSLLENRVIIRCPGKRAVLRGVKIKDNYICVYCGAEWKDEKKETNRQTYKIEMDFHDELKYESLVMGTPSAVKKHMVAILNDQLIRHMGRDEDFGPVELTKLDDVKTVANNRGDLFRLSVFVESEVSDYIIWAEPYEEVVIPIDDDGVPYTGWNEGFRTAIQEVAPC